MPGYEKCGKKTICCATCDFWLSDFRFPSEERTDILYESFQKAKCQGRIHFGHWTTPRHRCKDWKVWRKVNMPKKAMTRVSKEELKARLADQASELLDEEGKIDETKVHKRHD